MKVFIENGIVENAGFIEICREWQAPLVFISDANVYRYYGKSIQERFLEAGVPVHFLSFPAGEKYKSRTTKEFLENQMLEKRVQRNACLIGFGGGVTTDLAGFVASTYYRGLPLVLIPTTLLAMADACIGGKNGVNTSQGKNSMGTFYPPQEILVDIAVLRTLPVEEYRQGIVEMIKHGILFDEDYLYLISENVEGLLARDPSLLEKAIYGSIQLKQDVVVKDPLDEGFRASLNFGHTLGHALEQAMQYTGSHGEAVAWGMLWEAEVARRLGKLSIVDVERIGVVLRRYGFLAKIPIFDRLRFFEALQYDKKRLMDAVRMVVLRGIGGISAKEDLHCENVDLFLVQEVIEELAAPSLIEA